MTYSSSRRHFSYSFAHAGGLLSLFIEAPDCLVLCAYFVRFLQLTLPLPTNSFLFVFHTREKKNRASGRVKAKVGYVCKLYRGMNVGIKIGQWCRTQRKRSEKNYTGVVIPKPSSLGHEQLRSCPSQGCQLDLKTRLRHGINRLFSSASTVY